MIGSLKGKDDDKSFRRKEKQRVKEEVKMEKRRLKEEKLRKLAEDREKKKKSKTKGIGGSPMAHQPTLENFVQSENNVIPLLLEKCVKFIEAEGLESEGLYRVPGNRSHVELLFQKFDEGIQF